MRKAISITFMSGPLDGKTLSWEVPQDDGELTITIGRNHGLHVSIGYDQQVSRTHAQLIYEPNADRFFLVDKKSRNRTFVGLREEVLEAERRFEIAPDTLFRVGRTWLRLDGDGSSAETADADD
jgi:hypothetical protein